MKKAVLLDIDGTLLNAWDFVFDAIKHALTFHEISHPTDSQIKKAMGRALTAFYRELLPGADPAVLAKTHQDFQEKNFHTLKPFPKAKKTLKRLRSSGFLLAAVSNRMRGSLLHSLKVAKMLDYFDVIVSADDVVNPKPHREHVLVALKKLEVEPTNAYMVGDMEMDILAGKAAKVKTIGVTYGFMGKDIAKHNPDYLIDNIEELVKILK